MIKTTYLLDSNILIDIWNGYPKLLDVIGKYQKMEFKTYQHVAGKLAKKEFKNPTLKT